MSGTATAEAVIARPADSAGPPAAEVEGLVKRYGSRVAVDDVSWSVAPGEVFGLLGPNGAGKTTTLECLVGLRRPSAGRVRVLGLDPVQDADRVRRLVAVQPQEASLFPSLRVDETVRLWASFHDQPAAVEDVLERVGLLSDRASTVKRLSGGQRRRLLLAVTLVGRPRLLVLDEPAAGLDPQAREQLWEAIRGHREAGGTVLLTTHDMNEAAFCDRVVVMVTGRVAALGTPRELIAELAVVSTVSFRSRRPEVAERLRDRPGVESVSARRLPEGDVQVVLQTRQLDETLRHVASSDLLQATELSVTQGGLDDVFRVLAQGGRP
jgi:ABC-2 type transport system ATP-binding protein